MKSTVKTLEQAVAIVAEIVAVRKRWGKQAAIPYSIDQVMDAVVILHTEGRFSAPSDEEITKLRRQLAACEAREKGRQTKTLHLTAKQDG